MKPTKPPAKIFPISSLISELPSNVILPLSGNTSERGRLIIIGDVHGMRKSLEALLEKVSFEKSKGDHLVLTGDLTNKGPDSPGVVDLAIKLGASAVRGNHENAVLNAAAAINATSDSQNNTGDLSSSAASENESAPNPPSAATQSTASALSKLQLDWLAALPVALRIKLPPDLPSSLDNNLVAVHAGLVPGIPIEEQDPHAILHIRSLERSPEDEHKFLPALARGEESWTVEWNRWQDSLETKTTVIFGHDARRGLQISSHAIGLDSGCLYGNKLSAVVIEASNGRIGHQIIQVECADTPVAPKEPVKEGDEEVAT
ncbi:hypothetical protein N7495_000140 [Penicillium taxi]|uniref:uncharacterized protein n=1 Tax=Penicillium taxi TaxID=168475 RepID=UPI00254572E4|nr:uncharacterized protein N7495_000140 [Penicillium taxi]KAJ5907458.1 hypothetical protein N7495_000140 [Penicillium taxi]